MPEAISNEHIKDRFAPLAMTKRDLLLAPCTLFADAAIKQRGKPLAETTHLFHFCLAESARELARTERVIRRVGFDGVRVQAREQIALCGRKRQTGFLCQLIQRQTKRRVRVRVMDDDLLEQRFNIERSK